MHINTACHSEPRIWSFCMSCFTCLLLLISPEDVVFSLLVLATDEYLLWNFDIYCLSLLIIICFVSTCRWLALFRKANKSVIGIRYGIKSYTQEVVNLCKTGLHYHNSILDINGCLLCILCIRMYFVCLCDYYKRFSNYNSNCLV